MNKLKSHKTVEQIAKKHRLDVSFIQKQLDMGEPIEHEHTRDHELAMDIALQHLDEIPDYYTRLKKMEASAKKEHKKFKDVTEEGLRDWFGKSKSKEGKPGWVNVVTGGTCASDEPGEGTPKCVSSAKRASMTKAERLSASKRKKAADPGQQQKSDAAKPTYVSTDSPKKKMKEEKDHEYSMARSELSTIMNAAKRLKSKMGKGEGNIEAWVQSKITKAADYLDTAADYVDSGEMSEEADKKGKGSGKKDACYHKVKARYDVWPSAYASGALVKCRQKGAANWGNKSEEYTGIVAEILKDMDESCWSGYKQVGMKKKGKKVVPNCVPTNEETKCSKCSGKPCKCETPEPEEYNNKQLKEIGEAVRLQAITGNLILIVLSWRGKSYMTKMFFPQVKMPSRREIIDQIQKVYPGAAVLAYQVSDFKPGEPFIQSGFPQGGSAGSIGPSKNYVKTMGEEVEIEEGMTMKDFKQQRSRQKQKEKRAADKIAPGRRAGIHADKASPERAARHRANVDPDFEGNDERNYPGGKLSPKKVRKAKALGELGEDWQSVNRKDKTDGLSQAAVNAYRRENPGSKLQTAVTEKNPSGKRAARRKSFCSRMSGMKKRLTSAKTARDPDSRINKALRRWNCN